MVASLLGVVHVGSSMYRAFTRVAFVVGYDSGVIVRMVQSVVVLLSDLAAESDKHRAGGEGMEVAAPF
jgi:hypothetical protein